MNRRPYTPNRMRSLIARSAAYLRKDVPLILRTIRVSSAVASFSQRAFMKSSTSMITRTMSSSRISVMKQVCQLLKFEIGVHPKRWTEMRIPFFLIVFMLYAVNFYAVHVVYAVVPMMSLTRRVNYVKTSNHVPCEICKNAVADKMEYGHHPRQACIRATKDHLQQDACVSLLQNPLKGQSTHEICTNTKMTDCKPSITIVCDSHKKEGVCHVV